MKMKQKKQRKRRRYIGRYLMVLGAVALLIWAGYELWIRLDDFLAWADGVKYMSAKKGESYAQNLLLIFEAPGMRELGRKMLFLLGCGVFSIVSVCLRNRPRADLLVLALDVALIVYGATLGMFDMQLSLLTQSLKLIPLLVIAAACIMNYVQFCIRRRRHRKKKHLPPRRIAA